LGRLLPAYGYFHLYLLLWLLAALLTFLAFRRWRPSGWLGLALGNLAVFLLLLTGSLVAAEGWFYWCYDTTDGAMATLTSRRWRERHVRKNALGFRGAMLPLHQPAEPGNLRVAVIGDSFTFGQGIDREEDRFTEILERRLRGDGTRAQVFNLSNMGLNTRVELDILSFVAQSRTPLDLVILAYVPNDILEPSTFTPAYAAAKARVEKPSPLVRAVTGCSFALSFLYHRLTTFRDPAFRDYGKMVVSRYQDPTILDRHLRDLAGFALRCREMGAPLAVVTFPIFHPLWRWEEFDPIHATLGAFWRRLGIRHLDLREALRRHPVESLVVNRYDSHPNGTAHRIAAEAIHRELFNR
jgi:lysophospholipase L1-like esterase